MARNNRNSRNKNPNNSSSKLFRQLTRLLSGPVANFRQQNPRRLKRRQLANFDFKSASGQNFKRNDYSVYEQTNAEYMSNQQRGERYVDFDQMEYTPEIASALDIYADEMTTSNELNDMLRIHTTNEEIKGVLENLFFKVMNLEFNLFGWSRSMCKYGDYFLYLDIDEEIGIKHVIGLPQNEIERLEGEDKENPKYVQFQWNSGGLTLENWQVAHFRILGNDKYVPYGTSVLEPARRIWRQLTLMEDAVMAYRIVRSPERKVFYVDVGNIPPQDIEQYMQRVMTQMKRNQIVDVNTGRVDLRYNPMSVEEDYFIPVRGGTQGTRIENLPGGSYTGDIDDIKYLRDKLFAALKVPASYLSRSDEGSEDKTTLAQKDIRFARTIQRLQKSIISELEKVAIIHLFTLGYKGSDLVSFRLSLNNPSKLAELQELEHWRTKFDIASAATEGFFSKRWVFENIFNVSEKETLRMQRELFFDKKLELALEQSIKATETELGGGGFDLGGGGGATPGGLGGLGDEAGDTPETPEAGAETPETPAETPAEDTGPLLAEPGADVSEKLFAPKGKKKEATITKGAKGKKYHAVKRDRREKEGGARKKIKSKSIPEYGTTRNIFQSYQEMLNTNSLYETKNPNYIEERNIEKVTFEIKKLIEGLEIKNNENASQ